MNIRVEVLPFIGIILLVGFLIVLICRTRRWKWSTAIIPGAIFSLIFICYLLYFFRDPERTPPNDAFLVLAGADGVVTKITEFNQEQFKKLYALLDECGIPLPELGLRFVISNPDIHCVLMGARSVAEVEQNVAAIEKGPLPQVLLNKLDDIAALVPYRPFEEPFGMGRLGAPQDYKGAGPAR